MPPMKSPLPVLESSNKGLYSTKIKLQLVRYWCIFTSIKTKKLWQGKVYP